MEGNNLIKKGLVVAVILLFIGLAIAPSINANISKASIEPVPDLHCEGVLSFSYPEPGETYYESFVVQNIGEPDSLLDWEICDWPIWGTWTFEPSSWNDLTPEEGQITVEVTVIWPEEINDFGEIKLVNVEFPEDTCIIDLQITPKDKIVNDLPEQLDFKDIREIKRLERIRHPFLYLIVYIIIVFRISRGWFYYESSIDWDSHFQDIIHPLLYLRGLMLMISVEYWVTFWTIISYIMRWNWPM